MWFVPAILTLYLVFPLYWAIFSRAKNKTVFTLTVLVIWLLVSMVLRDRLRGGYVRLYKPYTRLFGRCAVRLAVSE